VKILGIDPGLKRCGIAISDSNEVLVFPRDSISTENMVDSLRNLIEEEGIGEIVVGRPYSLSKEITSSTMNADDLFMSLTAAFPEIPIRQHDERLTTVQARNGLQQAGLTAKSQKSKIDSAAAVVMLQDFCDRKRNV
jgi:putative holliday junction resolvase